MENDDANADIMSMQMLVIRAIKQCFNRDLLDFIYKLIEYHHKE